VIHLVRADRDATESLTAGLAKGAANFHTDDEEYSMSQVLQHVNGSFTRSLDRLTTLSSGRQWLSTGPPGRPGTIPPNPPATFADVRRRFLEGEDAVLVLLENANPKIGRDLTADHAAYGPFNWLEWALNPHHVHTHDYVGQIEKIERALSERVGS
jgi:hypothetical protein